MSTVRPVDQAWVGGLIGGKYKVLRSLGFGGMGAVYEAENTWTGRRVAIKVLRPELSANDEAIGRLLREARVASRVAHENIVDVLDLGQQQSDRAFYIVQELLQGTDLRRTLEKRGKLPLEEALEVIVPVMGALVAAHKQGVVHRDIKPENIFLARTASGAVVPKIIDFGISKLMDTRGGASAIQTISGKTLGSPPYMAPEQARGDTDIDPRADVWAVGVVLYETLSGRRPYDAPSDVVLMARMLVEDVPRIESVAPDISRRLADVIHGALAREREQRCPTMRRFLGALLDACDAGASPAHPPRYRAQAGAWLESLVPPPPEPPPAPGADVARVSVAPGEAAAKAEIERAERSSAAEGEPARTAPDDAVLELAKLEAASASSSGRPDLPVEVGTASDGPESGRRSLTLPWGTQIATPSATAPADGAALAREDAGDRTGTAVARAEAGAADEASGGRDEPEIEIIAAAPRESWFPPEPASRPPPAARARAEDLVQPAALPGVATPLPLDPASPLGVNPIAPEELPEPGSPSRTPPAMELPVRLRARSAPGPAGLDPRVHTWGAGAATALVLLAFAWAMGARSTARPRAAPPASASQTAPPIVIPTTALPEATGQPSVPAVDPAPGPAAATGAITALEREPAPATARSVPPRQVPTPSARAAREATEPHAMAGSRPLNAGHAPTSMAAHTGAPRAELPGQPTREQVIAVLAPLAPAVRRCALASGAPGVATARLTVLGDGTPARVGVDGPYAVPVRLCIARVLRGARFPRFARAALQLAYPYSIRP